ncbi:hypothetical protein [Rhodocista pekingensis]|uniref:Uncharacterized protein n=1 Tax=Rhodocista pekingensis TaxID=201185 RepID=A0ABW2KRG2_9PROT
MRTFLPALALLLCTWPAIALVSAGPAPDAAEVAVVFSPWSTAAGRFAALEAADAVAVRAGGAPFIWVVRSDRPGLAARLHAAGLLLLLDPIAAGGCRAAEQA